MSKMIQLVYISNSTWFSEEDQLKELLKQSRKNNQRNDLTGMLLFHDGQFFQVLEGPEDKVLETYEKIKQDPRHRACRKMAIIDIDLREFGDWTMGYYQFDSHSDQQLINGFNHFMHQAIELRPDEQESEAYTLLHKFKVRAFENSGMLNQAL